MKKQVPAQMIHRLLAPGPVVLATAVLRGRVGVTTLSWVLPLSGDPPLVGIAVRPTAFIHELIRRSDEFTLNIPHAEQLREVQHCGSVSSEDHDKLVETALHTASARQVQAPWIEECVAHIECGVVGLHEWGDHTLFVGQVLTAWAEETAFEDGWLPENEAGRILHHLGGKRYAVAERVLTAEDAKS